MSELSGAIRLPDGTPVRGRGRAAPVPPGPAPDFGLYLGIPPGRPRRREPDWEPDWPHAWIEWPDFRLPVDHAAAATAIVDAYAQARAGRLVEVACVGGLGRTGTVLACMAILAGHPADDAVGWVRAHYRRHAVETPWQKRWVRRFSRPV